jgi:hypothetical protein
MDLSTTAVKAQATKLPDFGLAKTLTPTFDIDIGIRYRNRVRRSR